MPKDQFVAVSGEVYKRLKDMGDGSHAEVIYATGLTEPKKVNVTILGGNASTLSEASLISGGNASNIQQMIVVDGSSL